MSFYLLFLNDLITSFFKKRLRCNGSVSGDLSVNCMLQLITNSSCNPFSLIISVNKQAVKVTRFIYIPKAHNDLIFNRNYAVMFLQ